MPQRAPPAPHSACGEAEPATSPSAQARRRRSRPTHCRISSRAQRHARAESRVAVTTSVSRLTKCQYQAIACAAFAR